MFDTEGTAPAGPAGMSLEAVESELVGMAGHLAAGTCRFLLLLAEFDTRDGWAGPGLRSCAHWLGWRVGMNLRTARDQLRVAHALAGLPAITAAFAAGRVSYSKVRALTRIATPANEATLLGIALHGTTSQLEALVAAARAGADPRPAAARRGLRTSRAADGSLLVRLRIPAERGEELLAVIDAYLDQHADAEPAGGSPEPSRAEPGELRRRGAEHAPGAVVEPLAARRLDALLDLLAGARAERPTTLVVHLRLPDTEYPSAWIEGGPAIPLPTAERITCTAAVQALLVDRKGNPLYLGRTHRHATRAQLRALRVRDGHRCRFPGCTSVERLEAHHVRWWHRDQGRTDLDELVLICPFHHTLIHDHGYGCRLAGHHGFAFTRPDGTPVPDAGPPTAGSVDELVAQHTEARLDIDDWTITPRWGGERLDPNPILRWLVPELCAARETAA